MHETLKDIVNTALLEMGLPATDFVIEHPADLSHGDFSTNAALAVAKRVERDPRELAERLAESLALVAPAGMRMDVAGPGFINFHLPRSFFTEAVSEAIEKNEKWGSNDNYLGRRIILEYTDPNPFKELHIGHLVPNALGESLAHLFEFSGAHVRRVTFQGDVGMHVAKAICGMQSMNLEDITAATLGEAYAKGAEAFESNAEAKEEIKALNKKIYERSDNKINALYDKGKQVSIEYFEEAYKMLGSAFDRYFFESETGPVGAEIVKKHVGSVFEKSDGAVIFPGEKYGLHTRVFINKEGLPTYEAKDIGLIEAKGAWWPFDRSITVTDTGQQEYFRVVKKAAELIMAEVAEKIELVPNGRLRLAKGKMSSRTGNVVPALSLIKDVKEKILARMIEVEIEEKERIAEEIAVGAIKYAILKSAPGRDIIFDFEKSISFEGDSGPYLQYTHARACSVLEKAYEEGVQPNVEVAPEEPYEIERILYRFPEVIVRAAEFREPHHVVTYLVDLAGLFNTFYAKERIADKADPYAPYKAALTAAVRKTLKNGLLSLGINAPERM